MCGRLMPRLDNAPFPPPTLPGDTFHMPHYCGKELIPPPAAAAAIAAAIQEQYQS